MVRAWQPGDLTSPAGVGPRQAGAPVHELHPADTHHTDKIRVRFRSRGQSGFITGESFPARLFIGFAPRPRRIGGDFVKPGSEPLVPGRHPKTAPLSKGFWVASSRQRFCPWYAKSQYRKISGVIINQLISACQLPFSIFLSRKYLHASSFSSSGIPPNDIHCSFEQAMRGFNLKTF